MRYLKQLSPEANQLRERFQNQVINPYISKHGSLKGYRHQIFLLFPRFDKRLRLLKGVSKEAYEELYEYLLTNQSQRRFNKQYSYYNSLILVREFENTDISICYTRVWHNGITAPFSYREHWKAQAYVLLEGVKKYGFDYYDYDYNFSNHLYSLIYTADSRLVNLYRRILNRKLWHNNSKLRD